MDKLNRETLKIMDRIKIKLNKHYGGERNYLVEPDNDRSFFSIYPNRLKMKWKE